LPLATRRLLKLWRLCWRLLKTLNITGRIVLFTLTACVNYEMVVIKASGDFMGRLGAGPPFKTSPPVAPKCSVKWSHRAVFVLVTSLCLAFSDDADIEFDFVLITSAYSQYLRDSCKQYLALIGS